METQFFTLSLNGQKWELTFGRETYADAFARMEFHSRLLSSLAPDADRVWREDDRMDADIVGWPKELTWVRTDDTTFLGTRSRGSELELEPYAEILSSALSGVIDGEESITGVKINRFSIRHEETILEYRFHGKGRTIAAFCVLFDLASHPRNDLEINIPRNLGIKTWPVNDSEEIQRTYGDPSKTADELRNEGWSRMGEGAGMEVSRNRIGGQIQQTYTLLRREQDMASQMQRSNISKRWKDALYESQNHTCQICLTQYDASLLEPDHRVPVIYEADHLSDENFLQKLMTLCRFCNQQKRETTKRLPADYDWNNSEWAYPERFDLEVIKKRILAYKGRAGSTDEAVRSAVDEVLGN